MSHDLIVDSTPLRRRKNLTAEEKQQIAGLREKGWGLERLAEHFKCTVGSISWCCLMHGVTSPGADKRKPHGRAEPYSRGGRTVRPFSPEEDEGIERMRAAGASLAAIGRATGRRHNSIVGRLCTLAKRKGADL
jgi:hypothetical protein